MFDNYYINDDAPHRNDRFGAAHILIEYFYSTVTLKVLLLPSVNAATKE